MRCMAICYSGNGVSPWGPACPGGVGSLLAKAGTECRPTGWREAHAERPRRSAQALGWMVSGTWDSGRGLGEAGSEGWGPVGGVPEPCWGLYLIWKKDPTGLVLRPVVVPLGQDITGCQKAMGGEDTA